MSRCARVTVPTETPGNGSRGDDADCGDTSLPIDWEGLARSTAHPLRISTLEILSLEGGRALSASELCQELQIPLSNISYHVIELAKAKLIKRVKTRQVRGSTETFYRVRVRRKGDNGN